MSEVM